LQPFEKEYYNSCSYFYFSLYGFNNGVFNDGVIGEREIPNRHQINDSSGKESYQILCDYLTPCVFVGYGVNEDMEANRLYAESMGVTKDDWPMFILYINSQKRNLTYTGDVTVDDMKAWITKATGRFIKLDMSTHLFRTGL
jgi:hypothetical protein